VNSVPNISWETFFTDSNSVFIASLGRFQCTHDSISVGYVYSENSQFLLDFLFVCTRLVRIASADPFHSCGISFNDPLYIFNFIYLDFCLPLSVAKVLLVLFAISKKSTLIDFCGAL
jgi:hypothetical protein